MAKDSHLAINDLLDVLQELVLMLEELNPGATEQVRRTRFLLDRAEKCIARAIAYEL